MGILHQGAGSSGQRAGVGLLELLTGEATILVLVKSVKDYIDLSTQRLA